MKLWQKAGADPKEVEIFLRSHKVKWNKSVLLRQVTKKTIVYCDGNVNDIEIESENENENSIWNATDHKFRYVSENFYVPYADLVYLRKNLIQTVKTQ